MPKPSVSGRNNTSVHLQTWILRVYIHCEGCKKKVYKVLQSIDGVYKTVIDSNQHKAIVTGSVNGETLVQKLLKSGKHAEILPESFSTTAGADDASVNSSKKKKKQSNKQNDGIVTAVDAVHVNEENDFYEEPTVDGGDPGNDQEIPNPAGTAGDGNGGGGGKKKKNKKNKSDKKENDSPPNGDTEGEPTGNPTANSGATAENVGASMEQLNLGPPTHQIAYTTPYGLPPYTYYPPTPAYGVSYSTSYPSAESSYYTPPVYGYAQSLPSGFYSLPPPNYRGSAFDDHDDEGGDGRWCTIM